MALKYKYDKETLTAMLIGADEEDRIVEIPKTVSYYKKLYDVRIGSYTYEQSIDFSNTKIKKIIISDGFTSIGNWAFYGCKSLPSITIPNSVTSIGRNAFWRCSSLTSITIPDSVTSIGDGAFGGCENLREFKGKYATENGRCIIVGSRLKAYANKASGTSFTIPDSVTSIGSDAFSGCSSLTSITIPNSVTSIGNCAFRDCSSLTSITIPDSVTSIGDCAFKGCSSLTSITIPNSVTSIRNEAFYGCRCLTSIIIPNSVTSIGERAFNGCRSLTSITIPDSVTSIGDWAFNGCENLREFKGKYVAENGRCIIVGSRLKAYANASGTSFNIPDSVTSIGYGAFSGYKSLTSITIPNSVTSIEKWAFQGCNSLTSVTIPNSVTLIEKWAFYGCESLNVEICNEDGGVNIQPVAFESTAKIKYLGKDAKVTIQTKSEKEETKPKKKGFFARLFGK